MTDQAQEPTSSSMTKEAKLNTLPYMVVILLAVLLMALTYTHLKVRSLERALENSPIVIVDFMQVAQQYPEDASPEELNRQMFQVSQAINKLGQAGYVVLDSSQVLAAPDALFIEDLYDMAMSAE